MKSSDFVGNMMCALDDGLIRVRQWLPQSANFSEIEKLQEELVDSEAILDGKRKVLWRE